MNSSGAHRLFRLACLLAAISLIISAHVMAAAPRPTAEYNVHTSAGLADAFRQAQNNGQDDIIHVAAGTYPGSFSFSPVDGHSCTVIGAGSGETGGTVLDAGGAGSTLKLDGSPAGGLVEISGVIIQGAGDGGLYIYGYKGALDVVLRNVVIQDNTSKLASKRAAGIYYRCQDGATLSLEVYDSVLRRNHSTWRGGAMEMSASGGSSNASLLMANTLVYGNSADQTGGALEIYPTEIGRGNVTDANLINCTIVGNTSADTGGGMRAYDYAIAENGTAISVNLYNTILYGNRGGGTSQDLFLGAIVPQQIMVRADHSDLGVVGGNLARYVRESVISIDPLFRNQAGGDYHLTDASRCIDLGTAYLPSPLVLPATDIDGEARVIGLSPDMGVDEQSTGLQWEFVHAPIIQSP